MNQSKKPDRIKITSSESEPSLSSRDYSPAVEEAANATSKESRTVKTTKKEGPPIDITTAKEKQGYGIFIIYNELLLLNSSACFNNLFLIKHLKNYRSGGIANSIAQRLGPPTAKLFDKEQPLPNTTNKKNIFARLGKEVAMVSLKLIFIRFSA